MKNARFLTLLCLLLLCFMSLGHASGLAEGAPDQAAKVSSPSDSDAPALRSNKKGSDSLLDSKATKKPKSTKKPRKTAEPEATKKPKKTAEPEATKKPKKTAEPEATKKPKKTAEPEATDQPAETETPEATKKPKKTAEPEATDQPAETETPKPTKKPKKTAEPEATDQPAETEAPEEAEATREPKPTKAPKLKLKGLKAEKKEVAPGEALSFTLTVENAETVIWSAQRSDGKNGGSGKVKGGSFTWKPKVSGVYTVTVNATAGEKTVSDSCRVIVRASKLKVSAKAETNYAQQGGKKLKYSISVAGGCEPYAMTVTVKLKGNEIFSSSKILSKVECEAVGYGNNKLTVTVTDALGKTAKGTATILSASSAQNSPPALPKLTGDMTFADKVVAVAKSQQGYRESKENFILGNGGAAQGWTYYGSWYGAPYDEWCAMFASYCLVKAGIGGDILPHSGNCNLWKSDLGARYIDKVETYSPGPGDLIFFHHDRASQGPDYPNHIGIVTQFDAGSSTVFTVEGNSGKSVRARQYNRGDRTIVGYASMRECMVKYDSVYKSRLGDQLADKLARFRESLADKEDPAQAAQAD